MDPVLTALDADTNQVISAEEISKASAALLKLDKNSDGKLAKDEFTPQPPSGGGPGGAPPSGEGPNGAPPGGGGAGGPPGFKSPIITALDANSDGALSAEEIAAAPTALKKLDKNSDGQLSRDEIMPPRPGGAGRGPGAGSQPPSGQ